MSNFRKICLFFLIALGIWGIRSEIDDKRDYKNGNEITVEVIGKPQKCEFITRKSYITIRYIDQIFTKKITKKYCPDLEKKYLKVILSQDRKTVYLLNEKDTFAPIAANAFIVLLGLFLLIFQRKKSTFSRTAKRP